MRYSFFILFSILLFNSFSQEQDYISKPPRDYEKKPAKTAFFIELGGNAGLYSLNIDKIYLYKKKLKVSVRGGFAPHFNGVYMEQIYLLENNFILFKNPHHLELGIGTTLQRRHNEKPNLPDRYFWENIWFSVWRFGYRYQKQDDGIFFRTGLTPVLISRDVEGFHPNYFQFWVGLSMGISF